MKFGVSLIGLSPRHYAEVGALLEDIGFESVWVSEHLLFPEVIPPEYPYRESGLPIVPADIPLYEPWIALAAVAASTTRIRLATNVYILPLRHPLTTARAIATLDRFSGGRVTLGAGVGWLRAEYDAVGVPFEERGARMDEALPLLRRLWTEPVVEHVGDHFRFGPVRMEPKPLQSRGAGVPIEVGGAAPVALRRAGRLGDGWIEIGSEALDEVAVKLDVVLAARRASGRVHLPFEVTVPSSLCPDLASVERAARLGVTRVIAGPPVTGAALTPESYRSWATHYVESVAGPLTPAT